MLTRADSEFCTGCARYRDHLPCISESSPKIYVRFSLLLQPAQILEAQLDTGAAWSILDASVAHQVGLLPGVGPPIKMHTRLGLIHGHLQRIPLRLLADEGGSLDVDATAFVSPDWQGGHFLGYAGLLERIRFAVDPSGNRFYFGRPE